MSDQQAGSQTQRPNRATPTVGCCSATPAWHAVRAVAGTRAPSSAPAAPRAAQPARTSSDRCLLLAAGWQAAAQLRQYGRQRTGGGRAAGSLLLQLLQLLLLPAVVTPDSIDRQLLRDCRRHGALRSTSGMICPTPGWDHSAAMPRSEIWCVMLLNMPGESMEGSASAGCGGGGS